MNAALSEQRIRNNKLRRSRELRRHRRVGLLILFMTIFFLSTFFSLRIKAESNPNNEVLSKYYTSIQVKSGDTLWHYANQYGNSQYYKNSKEYVNEVMKINSLRNDTIITGQYLILPYYGPAHGNTSATLKEVSAPSKITIFPVAGQL